jgi:hypothetical protein
MKQMSMLRLEFEHRWNALAHELRLDFEDLADAEDRDGEDAAWHRWISRFESLLTDTFWDVFEEAKRSLEPKPPEFAYKAVRDWCLAANDTHGRILIELECRSEFWEDYLRDLEGAVASEISPTDMVYRPQTALCLETIGGLPPRSRELRKLLSQIHPYLTKAMKNILAQEGCATLQEAVENFPVLRGLKEDELQRFRGSSSVTENTASKELLNARLRTVIGEGTVDRYFRPKEHSPR